jgi:hypothetical protein
LISDYIVIKLILSPMDKPCDVPTRGIPRDHSHRVVRSLLPSIHSRVRTARHQAQPTQKLRPVQATRPNTHFPLIHPVQSTASHTALQWRYHHTAHASLTSPLQPFPEEVTSQAKLAQHFTPAFLQNCVASALLALGPSAQAQHQMHQL